MKNHIFSMLTAIAVSGAILVGCEKEVTKEVVKVEEPVASVSNLSAVVNGETSISISLSWQYNSVAGDTFFVDRAVDGNSATRIATLQGSVLSYTDSGLEFGKEYSYSVTVRRNSRNSSTATISRATNEAISFNDRSVMPPFVKNFANGLRAFSLISSDDSLPATPNFIFGGSADGLGFFKNSDGTYTVVTNHEDNFAVSRLTLDAKLNPTRGEYLLSSTEGKWRLCSATLATPEEHGFAKNTFITCGESGPESQIHAVDAAGAVRPTGTVKPALGYWSTENAVPLPKTAFAGKTVVVIGDDDSGSDTDFGQIAIYISDVQGDLDNGKLYVMTRNDSVQIETDMVKTKSYGVTFKEIVGAKSMDFATFKTAVKNLRPVGFGRVEDIDYRKDGVGREVYFNVTGQNNTGANADYGRTKYGRVYKLNLPADFTTSLKATMDLVLDGDGFVDANNNGTIDASEKVAAPRTSGPLESSFTDVDNIMVTSNYLYTQEDANGYGDEKHDAYIYQYNLSTKRLAVLMELNHFREGSKPATKGPNTSISSGNFGSWEYGTMVDVSKETGIPNLFIICIQPHGWRGDRYKGVDGGTLRPTENQGSQLIFVKGDFAY